MTPLPGVPGEVVVGTGLHVLGQVQEPTCLADRRFEHADPGGRRWARVVAELLE